MRPFSKTAACLLTIASLSGAAPAFAQDTSALASSQPTANDPLDDARWYPATGAALADLIRDCEDASCMSYLAGTISGIATRAYIFGEQHPFCGDQNVHIRDIRDAVVTVVDSDPQLANQPSSMAILAAFSATWPCPGMEDAYTPQETATQPPAASAEPSRILDRLLPLERGTTARIIEDTLHVLERGNLDAPAENTIVVFHDVNCPHCAAFRAQTEALIDKGWHVRIVPVGIMSQESVDYAALMVAFAQSRPDAVQALHEGAVAGQADTKAGMDILAEMGIPAADVLKAIAAANAYAQVEAHNTLLNEVGPGGTPTWMIDDFTGTGNVSADNLEDVAAAIAEFRAQPVEDDGADALILSEDGAVVSNPASDEKSVEKDAESQK